MHAVLGSRLRRQLLAEVAKQSTELRRCRGGSGCDVRRSDRPTNRQVWSGGAFVPGVDGVLRGAVGGPASGGVCFAVVQGSYTFELLAAAAAFAAAA